MSELKLLHQEKAGRPVEYDNEVAAEICWRMHESNGNALPLSLRQICQSSQMPTRLTVQRWIDEEPGFRMMLNKARELRNEALMDRLMSIVSAAEAESSTAMQAIKLEAEVLKWMLTREQSSLTEKGDATCMSADQSAGMHLTEEDEEMIRRIGRLG